MKSILSIKNNVKHRLSKYSRKQLGFSTGAIVVALFVVFGALGNGHTEILIKAERGTVEEEVLVTGKTQSKAEVDLGFERSGRVIQASIDVGDRVRVGQVLVVLDQSDLRADLRKAEANLATELADLDSVKRTSTIDYSSAYTKAIAALKDAYSEADDAVRNHVDQFFLEPRGSAHFEVTIDDAGSNYRFTVPYEDRRIITEVSAGRRDVEDILVDWEETVSSLEKGDDLEQAFIDAETNLEIIKSFLGDVAYAVNSFDSYGFEYESTVSGYKADASAARTQAANALSDLLSAREELENVSEGSVSANENDVRAQEARVESIRADIESIEADLAKTVLRAPIEGVVTKADVEVGEIVTSGSELVTIISDTELRIEANVSEVNIGKVTVGNDVRITFDAFPGWEIPGKVVYIDPSETVVDGVAAYKVTVSFVGDTPAELRSGLTATLRLSTAKKEEAIKIPAYAVEKKDGKSFVTVKVSDGVEKREVTTGIRGKDGTIEIISGLTGEEELLITTE